MEYIKLLYVANTLTGRGTNRRQTLQFLMRVINVDFHKNVEVVWSGSDGVWHSLPAYYYSEDADRREYWRAEIEFSGRNTPGDVRFALRFQWSSGEHWDNNQNRDYLSPAGGGAYLVENVALQQLEFPSRLADDQESLDIHLAVDSSLPSQATTVRWSINRWQQTRTANCKPQGRKLSLAHRPNSPGLRPATLYLARLRVGDAFRIHYSLCCQVTPEPIWDNNGGQNYCVSRKPLTALILNLHCYQEDNQDEKFWQIAKAIDETQTDLVCLQEVAELWNGGHGDWPTNAANIINQRLNAPFHLYTDWSHLGFDRYREGVAILSRFPLQRQEARYVSDSEDPHSIHSRKVVACTIDAPYIGMIDVFSAHLSWWEDGFRQQFLKLSAWADSRRNAEVQTTMLCGDFNIAAGSTGYQLVVTGNQYQDQYLAAKAPGLFQQIFQVKDAHWRNYLLDDYRIDYIFMNKHSTLKVSSARVIFTDQDYGWVSDHCGYLLTFEPE